jgi:long-chain acyl-CoA synthetase
LPGTITEALAEMGRLRPNAVAIEIGGEAPMTYRDLFAEAQQTGSRLASEGLRPGQGVLVVTRSRPRVPALVHGAMLGGGVVVALEPSTPPAQLRTLAERAHCAFALGDPDLLDWLAPKSSGPLNPVRPQDPHLARIGDPPPINPPVDVLGRLGPGAPEDRPAFVVFTSGSTGTLNGVLLSHASLLAAAQRMIVACAHRPSDRHLSHQSFAHLDELFLSVVLPSMCGYTVVAPRGRRLTEAIHDARPTFFMGVPAEWQAIATAAAAQGGSAADVRAALGLDRVRLAMSTGAPLAPPVHSQLFALGLLLHEVYGKTETAGAVTYNAPGASRGGSVGVALDGSRVALDGDGEVQLFGARYRCLGYLDDPAATQALFLTDDGVRTGDLGSIDEEGYLFIHGRKRDLLVLSTGQKVHPARIEARIAALPGIRHAAVFGEGQSHLVAVIDAVNDRRLRTAPMAPDELRAHLTTQISRLNADLGPHERIAAVGVAPQPFTVSSGELTPERMVSREAVRQRHGLLIDALRGALPAAPPAKLSVPPGIGDILRFDDG